MNTYQLAVVSDSVQTYVVLSYNCDQLQWTGESSNNIGAIGYGTDFGTQQDDTIPAFFNHPLSKQAEVRRIACSNDGGDRNRPWTNVVKLIGEFQENANGAQCVSSLFTERSLVQSLSPIILNRFPCPCSFFQARRDRRYVMIRRENDVVYFVPRRGLFGRDFLTNICAYSLR